MPTQRCSTKRLQDSCVVCYFVEVQVEKVQKVSRNGERSEVSHSKSEMTVHVNVFTKQEKAVAGRILTSHHDRTESVRSCQNDYLNNFVAPVKSVALGSRSGLAVLTSLARREMTGSLDSDGIILLDNLKKAPHNLNSNQKSTGVNSASSETNQLWLQMRKRRAEPLPLHADDLASLTDKADAISLSLPAAHQIEGSADITSIYRMNLESQRLSNSSQALTVSYYLTSL